MLQTANRTEYGPYKDVRFAPTYGQQMIDRRFRYTGCTDETWFTVLSDVMLARAC